jgi:hypothetical protein
VDGVTTPLGRFVTPPQFTISMWISDRNSDGTKATSPWEKLESNYQAVLEAFTPYGPTVPVIQKMPDGSSRRCDARIVANMTPEMPPPGQGNPVIRCSWTLDIPAIFWRDNAGDSTFTTSSSSLTTVTTLSGATAPITDAVFKVHGPRTNPRIENAQGGFCTLNGDVPDGSTWVVDSGAFTSKLDGVSVLADTDYYHKGSAYLMELNRPYQVKLTGSGTGSLDVVATKKFYS